MSTWIFHSFEVFWICNFSNICCSLSLRSPLTKQSSWANISQQWQRIYANIGGKCKRNTSAHTLDPSALRLRSLSLSDLKLSSLARARTHRRKKSKTWANFLTQINLVSAKKKKETGQREKRKKLLLLSAFVVVSFAWILSRRGWAGRAKAQRERETEKRAWPENGVFAIIIKPFFLHIPSLPPCWAQLFTMYEERRGNV